MDVGPCLYCMLNYEPKGSGELIISSLAYTFCCYVFCLNGNAYTIRADNPIKIVSASLLVCNKSFKSFTAQSTL